MPAPMRRSPKRAPGFREPSSSHSSNQCVVDSSNRDERNAISSAWVVGTRERERSGSARRSPSVRPRPEEGAGGSSPAPARERCPPFETSWRACSCRTRSGRGRRKPSSTQTARSPRTKRSKRESPTGRPGQRTSCAFLSEQRTRLVSRYSAFGRRHLFPMAFVISSRRRRSRRGDRERGEEPEPSVDFKGDLLHGRAFLVLAALGGVRILRTPVRDDRLSGPDRTRLPGLVANGDHEIELARRGTLPTTCFGLRSRRCGIRPSESR